MPFKSKSQQRFMFAKHPKIAEEFAEATPNIKKLPEHLAFGGETNPKHETIEAMENNPTAGFANGGEVENKTFLEQLADKLRGSAVTKGADDADAALHVEDSTDTVKGYADGGDVGPDQNFIMQDFNQANQPPINPWMQGAAEKAAAPMAPQPWMQQPDAGFMQQLQAGTAIPPPAPAVNPVTAAASQLHSLPQTPPSIYQGMTAQDRAAMMQKLLAQKTSPGMMASKGLAGLGDAITSAFGKSPTTALKDVTENQNKNIEQKIGVMDTERQQKLQDLEANQSQALNDPNSSLSQSMRKTLKSAGMNVPSGMSGAIMLKIAGPLGELAMKQATLAETGAYHKGELAQNAANRETKEEEYRSEHPILNWLNPVGEGTPKTPVSNPNAPGHSMPGHGVPELGSTFNGQKITGVKRIR